MSHKPFATAAALAAILILAAACGNGEEPSPEGGDTTVAAEQGAGQAEATPQPAETGAEFSPDTLAAREAAAALAASIEVATDDLVSAIEPDDFVAEVRAALAHAGTREDPIPITTDFLGGWQFDETRDDPFPPHVKAIDGKYVIVKGFMLPDVDFEGITKFHLVRSLWGCCFGAPPRVNELIRIHTPGGEGLRYTYNTLEIVGKIEVKFELLDGLIEDLYRLQAESIVEGDFDDPLAPEGATAADLGDFLPEMEF
ncbi:MAG: hypothetical protein CMJ94_03505 [Planctomycetes bacterium]|nr:hypothetical protein [Planctomycetota bacterium]